MLLSFALVLSLSPLALLSTSVGSIGIADAAAFADNGEVKVVADGTHDGGVVDGPHRVGSFELGTSEAIEEAPLGFVYFDEATPAAGTEQKIAIAVDDQGATVRSAVRDPVGRGAGCRIADMRGGIHALLAASRRSG